MSLANPRWCPSWWRPYFAQSTPPCQILIVLRTSVVIAGGVKVERWSKKGSERETATPADGMGVLILGDSGYTPQDERGGLEQSAGVSEMLLQPASVHVRPVPDPEPNRRGLPAPVPQRSAGPRGTRCAQPSGLPAHSPNETHRSLRSLLGQSCEIFVDTL
jgi:hypothetical protein